MLAVSSLLVAGGSRSLLPEELYCVGVEGVVCDEDRVMGGVW